MDNFPIKGDLVPEFAGEIIDIFEDFLDSKDIELNKTDDVFINGFDYDGLESSIISMLKSWGLAE